MVTSELLVYIQKQLQNGVAPADIKTHLLQANWHAEDIDAAIQQAANPTEPTPIPPQNIQTSDDNNHAIIVILLLLFFYPVGLILMWMWMKQWPKWVKILLSVLGVLYILGIIASILTLILVALNPSKQLSQSYDIQRRDDTVAILNSVEQYKTDHNNRLPSLLTTTPTEISSQQTNLCPLLVPTYIDALPVDPSMQNPTQVTNCSAPYDTGYTISMNAAGQITVSAPRAKQADISTTR